MEGCIRLTLIRTWEAISNYTFEPFGSHFDFRCSVPSLVA